MISLSVEGINQPCMYSPPQSKSTPIGQCSACVTMQSFSYCDHSDSPMCCFYPIAMARFLNRQDSAYLCPFIAHAGLHAFLFRLLSRLANLRLTYGPTKCACSNVHVLIPGSLTVPACVVWRSPGGWWPDWRSRLQWLLPAPSADN